uniref:Transmembrane protein n=1 Tax=uncultured bacterium BLR18 TaxID=506518 RepID=C0INL6_9BACT|nr:hypothetical protein AKSOIL_0287 [uncultured bacterium BLR18]
MHGSLHERVCFFLPILSERKKVSHRSTPDLRNLSLHATVDRISIVRTRSENYIVHIETAVPERRMLSFVMWLVLLFLCWPLALLALVLYPLVWLILLPFRLLGIGVEAVFELLRAIVLLPARVLRGTPGR